MVGAIRTLLSLAAVLALAACSSAPAPAPAVNHDAENAAWIARDFTCTRAEAKAVSFDTLLVHPERFDESCVWVKVFFDGGHVMRDANQVRIPRPKIAIDAYMKNNREQAHYLLGPTFATVTGRVRSCAARKERETSATTPLCHSMGFGVFVSDVQVVPTAMD